MESLFKTGVLPSTWFGFDLVLLLPFWFWWVLYSKTWFCADTSISCYCIISSWICWCCSAQNVPSSSHLHSYLFFSFLPTRFGLMPLSAVLPRGRQKVKQEKAVFLYGMSAVSCRVFCARSPRVQLGFVVVLPHHWWRGLLWVCTHHTVGCIVEVEKVLPALTGPRWESLSGY